MNGAFTSLTRPATTYKATHGMWDDDDYGYESTYQHTHRWDYAERRYVSMHDGAPLESLEYDDEAELWQEDMEELALQKYKVYMTYIDNETSLVECYSCTSAYTVDESSWPTECPSCSACLHCGHIGACNCWLGLEDFFWAAGFELPKGLEHTTLKELSL